MAKKSTVKKTAVRDKKQAALRLHPLLAALMMQAAMVRTMPLYVRLAADPGYAERLARAINDRNPDETMRLVKEVLPYAAASAGAGFSAMYDMGGFNLEIGTFRPGKKVSAQGLREVADVFLPLMRTIAADVSFALRLMQQYGKKDPDELKRLVTFAIPEDRLRDAGTDPHGFYLVLRTNGGANYNFTLYLY